MSYDAHLTQPGLAWPGLAWITIHSADLDTVNAVAYAIAAHLNATGPSQPHRVPGEAGFCVSQYAHAQPPTPQGDA